jgi:hypothetical protein
VTNHDDRRSCAGVGLRGGLFAVAILGVLSVRRMQVRRSGLSPSRCRAEHAGNHWVDGQSQLEWTDSQIRRGGLLFSGIAVVMLLAYSW